MGKLKILGTVGAVALMVGVLAPGSASAQPVSSEARMSVSDGQFTDGDGNKLSSDFFAGFTITTDVSTTANLATAPFDGDGETITFNKTQFEGFDQGDLVGNFSASSADGTSSAASQADLAGALVNRGGANPTAFPNTSVNTEGSTELNAVNTGGTATEVFAQVFNFTVAEGVSEQEIQFRVAGDLFLETIEAAGDLFATGIGADASWLVTLRLGPPEDRVTVDLRDLLTNDVIAGGDLMPGFGQELDDVNETASANRAFNLTPIDGAGDQILFNAGMQGSLTLRQEANTTVATGEDIPEIPVPATMMLLGTGLLGLGFVSMQHARRRRNTA